MALYVLPTRVLALVLVIAGVAWAQGNFNYYREKPGSCPPPLPVQICSRSCLVDAHCESYGKCCPTSCGGAVCSRPVTQRQPNNYEKPGLCPREPTGRWICSSMCTIDSDCRGMNKCCKNRCGALVCQKPEVNIPESEEQPFDETNFPASSNPFIVLN
ncbi:waprin-Phi1 [Orussus abietinus]|uniref:waprin-Phi1 n=1 Tax=Orussus abietinus TaxID=222816 RepID=UPI0006262CB9|nr:waprin-Phi1 [Orussus abietinus]